MNDWTFYNTKKASATDRARVNQNGRRIQHPGLRVRQLHIGGRPVGQRAFRRALRRRGGDWVGGVAVGVGRRVQPLPLCLLLLLISLRDHVLEQLPVEAGAASSVLHVLVVVFPFVRQVLHLPRRSFHT